jgi:hypothetical protein
MMKAVAKTVEPADREARFDLIRPLYLEALTLVERMHRRLLDVIKDEFDRRSRGDINSVQALLLYNIGEKELTAGELRRILQSDARYYNMWRTHRSLDKDAPIHRLIERFGRVAARSVLGGLHHRYCRI